MASEMAGRCLFSRGVPNKSLDFYAHAISQYQLWGAKAIVKRVENEVLLKFGASGVKDHSFKGISTGIDDGLQEGGNFRKRPGV